MIKTWLTERDLLKPEGMTFFVSEQLKPMHRSTVNLALKKYGELANLSVAVHPRCVMLAGMRWLTRGGGHKADSGLSGAPEHSARSSPYRE